MKSPLDLAHRLRAWTYRRQGLVLPDTVPADALRAVVAVYSSHPTAPLALAARSTLAPEDLGAMEVRRDVLRLPAMRRSIFVLPTDTAPRVFAATRASMAMFAPQLRYAGFDPTSYEALKPQVLSLLGGPMSTVALREALPVEGTLVTLVRLMSFEGLTLRLGGRLRSDNPSYVATEAWLGRPLEAADPDASLRWLAEAYLRGYGPARVEDFVWWAGVTRTRARAALAPLDTVDVGEGLLLPADLREAFESVEALDPDAVTVLPKWDAYTMGLAPDGRRRFLDDAHRPLAYTLSGGAATSGDGLPLVLRGGRAVASWSHRFAGDRMTVNVTPFAPRIVPQKLVANVFERAGEVLGATSVEVSIAAAGA